MPIPKKRGFFERLFSGAAKATDEGIPLLLRLREHADRQKHMKFLEDQARFDSGSDVRSYITDRAQDIPGSDYQRMEPPKINTPYNLGFEPVGVPQTSPDDIINAEKVKQALLKTKIMEKQLADKKAAAGEKAKKDTRPLVPDVAGNIKKAYEKAKKEHEKKMADYAAAKIPDPGPEPTIDPFIGHELKRLPSYQSKWPEFFGPNAADSISTVARGGTYAPNLLNTLIGLGATEQMAAPKKKKKPVEQMTIEEINAELGQ